MKTSILISSIAALYLLLTFAEAPRRYGEDKMDLTSKDHITVVTTNKPIMLPGVVITPGKLTEYGVTLPDMVTEDFSYLEFDVKKYLESDALTPDNDEILPEASETDFRYLKFNSSDYVTDSEFTSDELTELPISENSTIEITVSEPLVNKFEFLKFDVSDHISNSGTIGDLLLEEAKTGNRAESLVPGENTNKFGYFKFYVTKYIGSDILNAKEQFELPE